MSIKADLHNHSLASDGKLAPEKLVRLASKLGIRVFSITDHDTLAGLRAGLETARLLDMMLIPGFEYTRKSFGALAHLLVYGDSIKSLEKALGARSIPELLDTCSDENLVCVLAHPFGRYSLLGYPLTRMLKSLRHRLSGIEVANGAAGVLANLRALRCFWKCNPGFWIPTAGSDSHEPETLGSAYIELADKPRDFDELLDLLKRPANIVFSRNPLYPYIRFAKSKLKSISARYVK